MDVVSEIEKLGSSSGKTSKSITVSGVFEKLCQATRVLNANKYFQIDECGQL